MASRTAERWRWRLVLAEAAVYLIAARLALALFSFQQLTWFFARRARQPELSGAARRRMIKEVRRAIFQIRRSGPLQTTCFHRAIAAQAMLRRRGVSATLYYGAATLPGSGLVAHAWVQDGAEGVVGHLTAQRDHYHVLARYPAAP